MSQIGVAMGGHDDFLPLVDVGDELGSVVLEAEVRVSVRVRVGLELVLDSLPCGEVSGFFVAVFPDGAP